MPAGLHVDAALSRAGGANPPCWFKSSPRATLVAKTVSHHPCPPLRSARCRFLRRNRVRKFEFSGSHNRKEKPGGMPVGVHRLKRTAERPLTNFLSPGTNKTTANAEGTTSHQMKCRADGQRVRFPSCVSAQMANAFNEAERAARVVSSPLVAVADELRKEMSGRMPVELQITHLQVAGSSPVVAAFARESDVAQLVEQAVSPNSCRPDQT